MKLRNDRGWQRAGEDLALQVLQNQLLISRVETEPRRQSKLSILHKIHLLHANNIFLCRGGGEDRGKMELLLLDKEGLQKQKQQLDQRIQFLVDTVQLC